MIVVAKIGTSSLTDERGHVRHEVVAGLCAQVAAVRGQGHQVLVVSSGAIGSGLPALGFSGRRPTDARTLQAVSAVGQSRLIRVYDDALAAHDLVAAQVLLSPIDFFDRQQYLHARGTLERLLELGAVPVINENDAVADDAIRFGDNDRIAALVGHLVNADLLVLLTDTAGLYTADPRLDPDARLVEEVTEVTAEHEALAGGAGTARGSGGMASKLAAAKMASWSGVRSVIAAADRVDVLVAALAGTPGVGTVVQPHPRPLSARKLWIAFGLDRKGRVLVDAGARRAVAGDGRSLLAVGVTGVEGRFERGDSVSVAGPDGADFACGVAGVSSDELEAIAGLRSAHQPEGLPPAVVHRDELVLLT